MKRMGMVIGIKPERIVHNPMQTPLASRNEGDWWAMAEEVFHTD
jgi:hypothetical protein